MTEKEQEDRAQSSLTQLDITGGYEHAQTRTKDEILSLLPLLLPTAEQGRAQNKTRECACTPDNFWKKKSNLVGIIKTCIDL